MSMTPTQEASASNGELDVSRKIETESTSSDLSSNTSATTQIPKIPVSDSQGKVETESAPSDLSSNTSAATQTQKASGSDGQERIGTNPAPSEDSSNTPITAVSTPNSAPLVELAHNDTNDHCPKDEIGDNDQSRPPDDLLDDSKPPKTPVRSYTNDIPSVSLLTENLESVSKTAPITSSKPDILYRTYVEDEEAQIFHTYYSDQKYKEWADPLKDDNRRSGSLLEIVRNVHGSWRDEANLKSKSMDKDQWRDKDLHVKFGEEFTIANQCRPLMQIYDPVCIAMMRRLIKYDPEQFLTGDYLYVHWPWVILMQYHEGIKSLRDRIRDGEATDFRVSEADEQIKDKEMIRRIDLLLGQIDDVYKIKVAPALQDHRTSRMTNFESAWLLFKPGEEVFGRVNSELAAFIVLKHQYYPEDSRTRRLNVHVWNFRLVAGRLVRHMSKIIINQFDGSRLIDTLSVFPSRYADPKHEAHRERLIARGKKYFSIIKRAHAYMDHKGLTRDLEPKVYNGHVVIDSMSYVKYETKIGESHATDRWNQLRIQAGLKEESVLFEPLQPNQVVKPEDNDGGELWNKYNDLDPTAPATQNPDFLEDRHFLLLPWNIRGFSLRNKQWETYDVNCLKEIVWGPQDMKDPFPGLILDEEKQKIIQANCRTAESRQISPDLTADQIGGKGEGTVFLLHGPPGVGKTHTVECIANYTRQPLLSLSGCDVGSTQSSETTVQHWFDLAKAWDALILIDEADIFLTWRKPDSLERNLLVTTFLRTIESFPGTLFLTTNRIGQLDLAFNSRVDIAVHFAKFDFKSQQKLWEQYFRVINKSARAGKGVYIKDAVIKTFLADETFKTSGLSGRDIRNAFKQSIKIARHDSQIEDEPLPPRFKLKLKHLQQAIRNCKEKTQHIVEANQVEDESELAEKRNERHPGFVTPSKVKKEANANNQEVKP